MPFLAASSHPQLVVPGVHRLTLGFVNAYVLTTGDGDWVLVDTGLVVNAPYLAAVAGRWNSPPKAIVLTHGHLDHAGSAKSLAEKWDVPIYVHRLEKPFVDGTTRHPPTDPTVGGALAQVMRFMPWPRIDLRPHLEILPDEGELPFLPGWQMLETPGHTPGHVSLWNAEKRTVIAGDALCTADFDTWNGVITQKPATFARPASPATSDWPAAENSVQKLAALEPLVVAAGHGQPMSGDDVPEKLRYLADHFRAPEQGRYIGSAPVTNEEGIVSLPPAPTDPTVRNLAFGLGALAVLGFVARKARKEPEYEEVVVEIRR